MKPVHLTLAGLQSYRDKQEVDFTALSDAGVFGIFGPTGSGKSSILDAMTLALYGKVERAPGGTQGIINQTEQVCSVSFTFELNGAGDSERYRVERQYKRTGDVSVNQTLSRLIRLEGGEASVLADKAKDVDARIQDILGLSMQDFTRAVVLPQGKFAEFLSLKGVERRHMLERLFHLEQYGDALGAKVSARLRETDMAVKQAAAEQLGLGDASDAALKETRERLAAAELSFREQRLRLEAAEREAEERRRLWKLVQERSRLEEAGRTLQQRAPEIEAGRERLRLSVQAGRVSHFLNEWEGARAGLKEAEARLASAQAEYDAALAAHTARQAAYQVAKDVWEREADPLAQRMESLKRAMALHGEIRSVELEAAERAARESSLRKSLEEAASAAEKEQQQLRKAQTLQAELKQRLAALELAPGYRERLQAALMALQQAEHIEAQAESAAAEQQAAEAKLAPLRDKATRVDAQAEERLGKRDQLLQGSRRLQAELEEALQAAEQLLSVCSAGESAELHREQERYRASLAANLAAALTEGEACPVCGSLHHPAPAALGQEAVPSPGSRAPDWKKLHGAVSERRVALKQLLGALAGEHSRYGAAAADAEAAPFFLREAAAAAEASAELLPYAEAAARAEELDRRTNVLSGELAAWSRMLRDAEAELQQLRNGQAELGAQVAALELSLRTAAAKREQWAQEQEERRRDWAASFPDFTPEGVREAWPKLQETLREQEELRTRLDKAEPYITSSQDKLNRLKEDSFRLEREAVQAAAERRGREELLQEKRSRLLAELKEPLSEEETAALWRRTGERLQALKQAEAEGRLLLEELQQKLLQTSTGLAAARQAHVSAASAHERAETAGLRELAEAGFSGAEAARAALLEPAEAARLEEQVERHREQTVEIRSRLQQLAEALAGASVTEAEWASGETLLAAERQKDEENLRAKAKAERDLEELEAKHERWLVLERERLEALTVLTRLQKLQAVLRGNAFVEFMAEEQLAQVSRAASERLGQLTRRRYALETDSTGGFIIRDDANGGLKRPVSTLSGGETFLTSLSLALALSAQIQLNGKYPLEFFFLDEGFGTLDPDLLETVVHALEKLHMEQLTVGVISHVPELKSRLPRRLVVTPADPSGAGSRIGFERL